MSEELLQTVPHPLGRYRYYRLGSTTLRQLKQAGLVKAPIPAYLLSKKPDGLITLHGGTTKAVVEYKPPSEIRTETQIQAVIDRDSAAAAALCKLLIITSGTKTIWINALNGQRVQSAGGADLSFVVDAQAIAAGTCDAPALERLVDAAEVSLTASQNTIAAPEVLDPSGLANTIWQKIWVQTAKSPEKCLYNVVELFVFKFLSDLGVLEDHNGFWSVERLVTGRRNSEAALKHYAQTCRKEVQELFPAGEDGTTIINGTIFVNESGEPNLAQALLFGEIIRDLAQYDAQVGSFRYIKREFKTRLYESFLRKSAAVQALGQHFTPRNVVQAMVRMATKIYPGARICDPFCGVGGFLLELLMEHPTLFREYEPKNGRVSPNLTLVGYDKGTDEQEDERTIILAKANMLIYFSDLLAKHHEAGDLQAFARGALNSVFRLLRTNLGTFGLIEDDPYDLILTNPPYVTSGSRALQNAIAASDGTKKFYDLGLKGTEGLALNWIIKHLRPGGEALVIVPDSVLRRKKELGALRDDFVINAIVSLPSKTFYATPRKTYILALERKVGDQEQCTPVFAYLVRETGETRNAKRIPTPEKNDLTKMESLFGQFLGAKSQFRSDDPLCKVVSFEDVKAKSDWRVDRWWGYEERVELGLEEPHPKVSEEAFMAELDNMTSATRELLDGYRPGLAVGGQDLLFSEALLGDSRLFRYITDQTGWTERVLLGLVVDSDDGAPVYTAALSEYGYVAPTHDKLIHASVERPLISFASNGDSSAGTNFVYHTQPFYVTRDRTVLQVQDQRIDPQYLLYALRNMKAVHGFDHTHKAVPANVAPVSVRIPVAEDGGWDLEAQRTIARRYRLNVDLRGALSRSVEAVMAFDVEIGAI
ncbi:MAG: N-6 DNA methylase [Chloroflexi bacterium]|nr:N-6 DNA methylase [Chloroflexota bacterium]